MSVRRLVEKGYRVIFEKEEAIVERILDNKILFKAYFNGSLWIVEMKIQNETENFKRNCLALDTTQIEEKQRKNIYSEDRQKHVLKRQNDSILNGQVDHCIY